MKSQKTAENVKKSTAYALQERERSQLESQDDVGAIETVDLSQVMKGSVTNTYLLDEHKDSSESRPAGTASLAVILGQLVAYFSGRADVDDMDVLSFSLHHLFCRVDFLYCKALPALQGCTEQNLTNELRCRQCIWSELQRINRTLDRMEPLCHLLSDATECMLDAFDFSSANRMKEADPTDSKEGTISDRRPLITDEMSDADDEQSWLQMINQERWEQALTALAENLEAWQQSYRTFAPFKTKFAHLLAALPALTQLDTAFATLLDCTGMIFGDILPAFRAIAAGDEETIAALLFDLMQQSDQLLVQFDMTLEPINELIKHFAIGSEII